MHTSSNPRVAIINFGMGNLFSIQNACQVAGLNPHITSDKDEILSADGVILPGVGAFGNAMTALKKLGLIDVIHQSISSQKPFMGICLGMQLLMSESHEFGRHEGLSIFKGTVKPLNDAFGKDDKKLKVPHVGWNRIYHQEKIKGWEESMLAGVGQEEFMYFVHSFFVEPENPEIILSFTQYGGFEFCSSISFKNIFACQFHPEKSADKGLQIYKNWAKNFKFANQ